MNVRPDTGGIWYLGQNSKDVAYAESKIAELEGLLRLSNPVSGGDAPRVVVQKFGIHLIIRPYRCRFDSFQTSGRKTIDLRGKTENFGENYVFMDEPIFQHVP